MWAVQTHQGWPESQVHEISKQVNFIKVWQTYIAQRVTLNIVITINTWVSSWSQTYITHSIKICIKSYGLIFSWAIGWYLFDCVRHIKADDCSLSVCRLRWQPTCMHTEANAWANAKLVTWLMKTTRVSNVRENVHWKVPVINAIIIITWNSILIDNTVDHSTIYPSFSTDNHKTKQVVQLWQRDRAKLDTFSINVERYSQEHQIAFWATLWGQ